MIENGKKAIVIMGSLALLLVAGIVFTSLFVIAALVKEKNQVKVAPAIAARILKGKQQQQQPGPGPGDPPLTNTPNDDPPIESTT